MIVKILTEHHLEFLSFKGGCRGSSESTLVKMLEISCRGSLLYSYLVMNLSSLHMYLVSLNGDATNRPANFVQMILMSTCVNLTF